MIHDGFFGQTSDKTANYWLWFSFVLMFFKLARDLFNIVAEVMIWSVLRSGISYTRPHSTLKKTFQTIYCSDLSRAISNGISRAISNGIGLSPIRSVIIRVIKKSDDRASGVRFVYHGYD